MAQSKKVTLESRIDESGSEQLFKESSELGEVMENLDDDRQESSGLSRIDFNTRLRKDEIGAIMTVDELTRIGVLENSTLTRQKKRLSVSEDGKGREEKVRIVSGERENRSGAGFGDRLRGLFQRRE